MSLWQLWVWQQPNGDTFTLRVTTEGKFYLFWQDPNGELVQVYLIEGKSVDQIVGKVVNLIGEPADAYRDRLEVFTAARLEAISGKQQRRS